VRFYLTTAIDYVNSRPHLGTAYEKITADVIARYKRLCGFETHFLMGNDEHSQNVYKRAAERGIDPLAYCDQMEHEFRQVWSQLDISFDDFIRTTEPRHRTAVEKLAQASYDRGDLYEGVYEGWYCVSCEAFKHERELVDGKCPLHPTLTPEWIREKNYFFRLSKYRDALLAHFAAHPTFLEPEIRRNEILRLLEAGLDDISVSRAGQLWGIPLPFAPQSVIYVWFDALINYISAVGYGADDARFETWWPADLHVIGKDITRFHTVWWPALLMSAGVALPRQVFGHGWVHFGGQRISKSAGTSLDPADVAARFGPDPLRLYLTKEISYGNDGDFTWDRYEERYNVDLANNLGNLVSRLVAMAERYRGGRLTPAAGGARLPQLVDRAADRYRAAMDVYALHEGAAAVFGIVDATNEFITEAAPWTLAKDPGQSARLDAVLFDVAEAIRVAAVLLLPIMPSSSAEILRRVGERTTPAGLRLDRDGRWRADGEREIVKGPALWPRVEVTAAAAVSQARGMPATVAISPRVEETVAAVVGVAATAAAGSAQEQTETTGERSTGPGGGNTSRGPREKEPSVKDESTAAAGAPAGADAAPAAGAGAPQDSRIAIEDFMKVELRVAKVLAAEAVPKSKKLIRMTIDSGTEHRTIVAGIAEAYPPEQLVGRTIVIVANLKPARLMGIESNGMVLAASPEGGPPVLVMADDTLPAGTRVR
jgi:methionyl-tRNA synthetase